MLFKTSIILTNEEIYPITSIWVISLTAEWDLLAMREMTHILITRLRILTNAYNVISACGTTSSCTVSWCPVITTSSSNSTSCTPDLCRGLVVAAACRVLNGDYGVAVTEALAVEEGIRLAREMELQRIIVESDACVVVDAIN